MTRTLLGSMWKAATSSSLTPNGRCVLSRWDARTIYSWAPIAAASVPPPSTASSDQPYAELGIERIMPRSRLCRMIAPCCCAEFADVGQLPDADEQSRGIVRRIYSVLRNASN